jgi:glycosyltransferase involved in cell wall biosynthesis
MSADAQSGRNCQVSIVIPVHNRSDMLADAIASCRASAPALELQVIVIDDASSEDIAAVVAPLHVVYERLPVNSGSSVARNRGLARAAGEYIKYLDSDDVLIEGALQHEYEMARDSGADIVVAGWVETQFDRGGEPERILGTFKPPSFTCIPDDLLAGRAVPTSAALYTRAVAAAAAWDPLLSKLNDWDYFVSAALRSRAIASSDKPSYKWRQHPGERITSSSTFAGNAREFYAILTKLQGALEAANEFTPARRERMAQYLYKELRGMYRFDPPAGRQILRRLYALDPRFVPRDEERSPVLRQLYSVLPAAWVLSAYGAVRRTRDRLR